MTDRHVPTPDGAAEFRAPRPGISISEPARQATARLNEIYLRGQARAFKLGNALDPSRINGTAYPIPSEPHPDDFGQQIPGEISHHQSPYRQGELDEARRRYDETIGEALASVEKHALSGVWG